VGEGGGGDEEEGKAMQERKDKHSEAHAEVRQAVPFQAPPSVPPSVPPSHPGPVDLGRSTGSGKLGHQREENSSHRLEPTPDPQSDSHTLSVGKNEREGGCSTTPDVKGKEEEGERRDLRRERTGPAAAAGRRTATLGAEGGGGEEGRRGREKSTPSGGSGRAASKMLASHKAKEAMEEDKRGKEGEKRGRLATKTEGGRERASAV
jgi:hypothetical protein